MEKILTANNILIKKTEAGDCNGNVSKSVCIKADVTITPSIKVGKISSNCIGSPQINPCLESNVPANLCVFTVNQKICVDIPMTFSTIVTARPTGIKCGVPTSGSCPSGLACTYTIGFYKNHSTFINSLIMSAGGFIVLGIDSQGASFTVTPETAVSVLSFETPAPPAPVSGMFAMQYQQLYAQLLAANLNVLNGAVCNFALAAISNANTFLAESPSGTGKAGAPVFITPLEEFNEGTAAGCPAHCPGI